MTINVAEAQKAVKTASAMSDAEWEKLKARILNVKKEK